jgi:hypothetical protein
VSDVNEPGFEHSIHRGRTLKGLPDASRGETGIGVNINDISCEGGGAISAMQNSHYYSTTTGANNYSNHNCIVLQLCHFNQSMKPLVSGLNHSRNQKLCHSFKTKHTNRNQYQVLYETIHTKGLTITPMFFM